MARDMDKCEQHPREGVGSRRAVPSATIVITGPTGREARICDECLRRLSEGPVAGWRQEPIKEAMP